MSDEIFDKEEVQEEYEGDKEILAKMLEIFDRDVAERLPKLREAAASGDCPTLMSEAHALKGGLGTFFAKASYETAYQLETMGRDENASGAAEVLATLETQLTSFRQAVGELIQ